MSQTPKIHPKVRKAAHWLTGQLFDELALENASDMEPHFAMWMAGFRIVIKKMYQEAEPTTLLGFASRQAGKYYDEILIQRQHTKKDRVWFCFILAWGLLMSCNYFSSIQPKDPFAEENPQDYLTLEALHYGYYTCLIDAVQAMLEGQGTRAIGIAYSVPESCPIHVLICDN